MTVEIQTFPRAQSFSFLYMFSAFRSCINQSINQSINQWQAGLA